MTFRIAVVCTGNICRSPIGAVVLAAALAEAGIDAEVTSYGTGGWHVGDPMDPRSARVLIEAGYDASRHRAAHFTRELVEHHDLVLAMDAGHRAELVDLGVPRERIRLFRDFDPLGPGDVPDPYYSRDAAFLEVLETCRRTAAAIAQGWPPA